VTATSERSVNWTETHPTRTVALNVGGRYLTLAIELLLGLVMLPFNMRYLGMSDYGVWMLAASIVSYFPILDLGYGIAMERFVARYRAERNVQAINEIASTAIFLFAGMGLIAFAVMAGIAWHVGEWFQLDATRARTGSIVMLLVAAQFAIGFPFGCFGAVVNGFQRQYVNATIALTVAVAVAVVNLVVVLAGGGLVDLVAATTLTRLTGFLAYRLNAYRVFPSLQVRPSLVRWSRVREMSGFSVYMLVQDLSTRANYASDPILIAVMLSTGSVAIWTVAQRLADVVLQLTNQLNQVLFPVVVECDTTRRDDRLRDLLVQGTRLSLATTLPVAGALAFFAEPVVRAWTGPDLIAAADVLQVLAVAVVVRVGSATAGMVLQGGGAHRMLAGSNLVAAVINLLLSVALVARYGLPGVAFATLLPIACRAVFILVPKACERVGLSLRQFFVSAVWPALWPGIIVLGGLALIGQNEGAPLVSVLIQSAAAGLLYIGAFLGLAVTADDRSRYSGKLRSVARGPALNAA
jgi:O-antigen/teichoic acid export membrane protein